MLRIKELLKEKGVTAKELAERIGISQPAMSFAINGNPTVETLEKIASALDVPIVELFEQRGDFVAMVSAGGETRRFDSAEDLADYIRPMIEG